MVPRVRHAGMHARRDQHGSTIQSSRQLAVKLTANTKLLEASLCRHDGKIILASYAHDLDTTIAFHVAAPACPPGCVPRQKPESNNAAALAPHHVIACQNNMFLMPLPG